MTLLIINLFLFVLNTWIAISNSSRNTGRGYMNAFGAGCGLIGIFIGLTKVL